MKNNNQQYNEADLVIFPPYMSLFILVILLFIFSHAIFSILLALHVFAVDPGVMVIGSALTMLIIIFCNLAIIRGHAKYVKVLMAIATVYILTGGISWVFSILMRHENPMKLTVACILFPALALFIMSRQGYKTCVAFTARRCELYRATGETVLEAMQKKKRNKRKT